jgi:hypothetical protein
MDSAKTRSIQMVFTISSASLSSKLILALACHELVRVSSRCIAFIFIYYKSDSLLFGRSSVPLSPEYWTLYMISQRLISLSNPPWVLFPVPGTRGSLVNEGNILLLIHSNPSSIHSWYPLSSQLYLGMLLQLQISTFQLDRWHRQSVRNFPFPRVVIFHAVPISIFSSSYRAGHLWRGDISSMDLECSCFPTT